MENAVEVIVLMHVNPGDIAIEVFLDPFALEVLVPDNGIAFGSSHFYMEVGGERHPSNIVMVSLAGEVR